MPTSPPPERRYSAAPATGLTALAVVAALVMMTVVPIALTLERRQDADRQWEELRTVYQAGRLGVCERDVDPRIADTCAKLTRNEPE